MTKNRKLKTADINEQVRQAIRDGRDAGLRPSHIATAAGTSQRAVSDFMMGGNLRLDTFIKIMKVTGITIVIPDPETLAANVDSHFEYEKAEEAAA